MDQEGCLMIWRSLVLLHSPLLNCGCPSRNSSMNARNSCSCVRPAPFASVLVSLPEHTLVPEPEPGRAAALVTRGMGLAPADVHAICWLLHTMRRNDVQSCNYISLLGKEHSCHMLSLLYCVHHCRHSCTSELCHHS